jgi:DNA polymerase III delta prime subunit
VSIFFRAMWIPTKDQMESFGFGTLTVAGAAAALWRNRYTAAYRLSKRKYPPRLPSVRTKEVALLKGAVQRLSILREETLLVYGPKGVGKTTALADAMKDLSGVVYVSVVYGLSSPDIINEVFQQLWPHTYPGLLSTVTPRAARNVLDAYQKFGDAPWVVLDLVNKDSSFVPVEALAAARHLSRFGLKVIIDASEGNLMSEPLVASRGKTFYLDYMPWDEIHKIPEYKHLLKTVEELNLTSALQQVIGGCPMHLDSLLEFMTQQENPIGAVLGPTKRAQTREDILQFLISLVAEAVRQRDMLAAAQPEAEEILKLFQTQSSVNSSAFKKVAIPNNTRVVRHKDGFFELDSIFFAKLCGFPPRQVPTE